MESLVLDPDPGGEKMTYQIWKKNFILFMEDPVVGTFFNEA
jgi:hypothetical protein